MNIFPIFEDIDITEQDDSIKEVKYKEPLFDFKTKKIVTSDGKLIMTTKEQHVQQYITLLIMTQVEKYRVYKDTDFGLTDLYEQQGKQILTTSFIIEELKRELREKVEQNPNVDFVEDVDISINFNTVNIEMTVQIDGKELKIMEAI